MHWGDVKRVLRYLRSTSGMGLVLGGQGSVVLIGHSDASWADDQATQHSSQGYTFSLGSDSVSWRSTRSSFVLSSRCEAEIYAGAMAGQELRWLTYLLTDLGEWPCSPPVQYVDNKAMLALCHEQRLEHRTKHIALRYFLARELFQHRQLCLSDVALRANIADVFTKALGSVLPPYRLPTLPPQILPFSSAHRCGGRPPKHRIQQILTGSALRRAGGAVRKPPLETAFSLPCCPIPSAFMQGSGPARTVSRCPAATCTSYLCTSCPAAARASRPAAARTSRPAALHVTPCCSQRVAPYCSQRVAPYCSQRVALCCTASRALLQPARRALLPCASCPAAASASRPTAASASRPVAASASRSAALRVAPCCSQRIAPYCSHRVVLCCPAHHALLQSRATCCPVHSVPCPAARGAPCPAEPCRPARAALPNQSRATLPRSPAPLSRPAATTAAAAAAARARAPAGGGAAGGGAAGSARSAAGAGGAGGATGSAGGAAGAGGAGPTTDRHYHGSRSG
ncbi:unnamed protein product [Closterium sp. NIES-54]